MPERQLHPKGADSLMKSRNLVLQLALMLALALPAAAHPTSPATVAAHTGPGGGFKKVSTLVKLPEFVPGLGVLYVDPRTLPQGPFLAYDRKGDLVSTVYMIPLKAMDAHKDFNDLSVGSAAHGKKVDHVDISFNAGHPGVAEPHYHVILWYVSRSAAAGLK